MEEAKANNVLPLDDRRPERFNSDLAGRPVLVGTRSIDKSEHLSQLLAASGIEHAVLNARHIAKEAEIVSQAGQRGKVTVATNMAGRGTDILLGGNPEYLARNEGATAGATQSPEEIEAIAEHPEQRHLGTYVDMVHLSIDNQAGYGHDDACNRKIDC